MKVVLITGCSSGIGEATARRLQPGRPHRLRQRPPAGDAGRTGRRRLPDAAAGRHRRGLDGGRGPAGGAGAGPAGRAGQQRGVRRPRAVRDAGAGPGPAPVRDQRLRPDGDDPALLPHFRGRRSGTIVNVSSMGGRTTLPGGGAYHGSKHAVEALSDALRIEVAQFGVDVVLIEPGVVRAPWSERARSSQAAAVPAARRRATRPMIRTAPTSRRSASRSPAPIMDRWRGCPSAPTAWLG